MTEQSHSALGLHPIEPGAGADHVELLKRRQIVRRTKIAALIVLVLLAIGAGRTMLSRMANARALEAGAAENARQYVRTTQAKRSGAGQTLALPGTLQGFVQAPIAARASGYLKRWTKDIGSQVAKGELLAEIETPEIDQQLSQAIAAREQAAASLALTKSTADRWEGLRKKDVVSQQDLEERRSAVAQSQASLAAADANVQRLRQLEGFKRVVAPFAGVITKRISETVALRARDLKLDYVHQGVADKAGALDIILKESGCKSDEVAFLGDDLVDLPIMRRCGLPMAVANAREEVKDEAQFITDHRGGDGAARDAIEFILRAQGKWDDVVKKYLDR